MIQAILRWIELRRTLKQLESIQNERAKWIGAEERMPKNVYYNGLGVFNTKMGNLEKVAHNLSLPSTSGLLSILDERSMMSQINEQSEHDFTLGQCTLYGFEPGDATHYSWALNKILVDGHPQVMWTFGVGTQGPFATAYFQPDGYLTFGYYVQNMGLYRPTDTQMYTLRVGWRLLLRLTKRPGFTYDPELDRQWREDWHKQIPRFYDALVGEF